ncbi:MAG: 1-phosphofructokinase [Ignavibacteriaceae bacterium]|nr:1-phosphofructokinase [Ignavibacteriaceae bacterium]
MILIVTLNPLLEKKYFINEFVARKEYRGVIPIFSVGGKGINVSRQLKKLKIDSLNFTFLGGDKGKTIRIMLAEEGLNFSSVKTKFETRDATVIIETDNRNVTTFFSENSLVTDIEVDEAIQKLDKMIQNSEFVVLSGSSPSKNCDKIFPKLIELANKYDKISVLDTYGNHFIDCINAAPTIIHNNISEISTSLNINLTSESEILEFLSSLYTKGIKQAFITDGDKSVYCNKADFHYKIIPPKIDLHDSTGSGDAFTAGIIYGHYHDLIFEETVKLAVSLGTINASSFNVCTVELSEADKIKNSLELVEIGKKLKTNEVA